ncbi:MAG TPA: permease prefix domain 1-containing protein [Solirubrobacteraceae bacterium]|nr:permease prefix domain 1-containing protein [Solirubrobacteraceae bacterium]
MSTSDEIIEAFLHAVDARLPGPTRSRADILAELKDGLIEAADANQRSGLPGEQAVRLAVQEFGSPQVLADSLCPELASALGRRNARVLLAGAPLVASLWIVAARSRGARTVGGLFDSPADHVAAAIIIAALFACAIWTFMTTGHATRWLDAPARAALLSAAATAAITIVADVAAVTVLGTRLAEYPGGIHELALFAAIAASCASTLVASGAIRSCMTMAKALRTSD